MEEKKSSNFIFLLALVCFLGWTLSAYVDYSYHVEMALQVVTWIYLVVAYLSILDKILERADRKKHLSLIFVQVIIYVMVFWYQTINFEVIKTVFLRKNLVSFFIIVETLIRFIAGKSMVDYNSHEVEEIVSKEKIKSYLLDYLLYVTRYNKEKPEVKKEDEKRIKVTLLNSFSLLIAVLAYAMRYIIDIINIASEEYHVPQIINVIVIVLMLLLAVICLWKGKLLDYNIFKTLLIVICTYVSFYLFLYKQYESINFVLLLLSIYFIGPLITDIWRVGRKYMS